MKYSQTDIDRVRNAADIRDFIPELEGSGSSRYRTCPQCGKSGKRKGLVATHKADMDIAKCFSCGFTLNGAIDAEMYFSKTDFPTALKTVADRCGIYLQPEKASAKKPVAKRSADSFCAKQLAASGLTAEDVMANVNSADSAHTIIEVCPFQKGGVDMYFNVNHNDDEMLILYYDLWGNRVQYATRGAAGRLKDYVRVRWSNPELHPDQQGKPIKYQTPKGAQTKFYIPQRVRDCFLQKQQIDTLIIQEGEKKAEKACKHGILSIGIQGIYNIGNEQSGLIKDLQYLVQTCKIKNVVLMLDSDWDHLHRNISIGDHIDQRPNQFSKAVIKFKQYVLTMHNLGVSVDVYFGHIKENEKKEKGIDDLLVGTLKGKENLLKDDIDHTLFSHDGIGEYVDIFKISAKSDFQIRDYWLLNDREAFFKKYMPQLENLVSFRFGNVSYRPDNGKIVRASRFNSEREFWSVKVDDKGQKKIQFNHVDALRFINDNGFFRIHTIDCDVEKDKIVRIDSGVVRLSSQKDIRDYVYEYVQQATKDSDVLNMFASKLDILLNAGKLERIEKIEDNFDEYQPDKQLRYFNNGCLTITADNIAFGDILGRVWSSKVLPRTFRRVPVLKRIVPKDEGGYHVELAENGAECEFLTFLINTCKFWRNPRHQITEKEEMEFSEHLVNKITALGYLQVDYKHQTELKAVIAMDGQMGDVGQSNGRSGKSLVGNALAQVLCQTEIPGRQLKNDDEFVFSDVTLDTRNIFIDDVRVNFDFGNFFNAVTGDLNVNPKSKTRFVIKKERSPKFYIATNHAINANDRSSLARIVFMSFSDYYNDNHLPVEDFGHRFFDEWDERQWNLFDNFMAECVQIYLLSLREGWYRDGQGMVPPPMADIQQRTLKQKMGEAFYEWAEAYFDPSAGHLNTRIQRKEMYDDFHAYFPDAKLSVTSSNFKSKLMLYCQFKGCHFNINKPDADGVAFADFKQTAKPDELFVGSRDVTGSKEYFTVSTKDFSELQPF